MNPFTLLVAVVLSAQATDASVNKATRSLFKTVDSRRKCWRWVRMPCATTIRTIGLYRNKAKNVIALSKALIENHGGEVPSDPRGARGAARRRPQDRKCGAERRLPAADHRGGYAYFPRRQPHRPCRERRRSMWNWAWSESCREEFRLHAHHWLILHGRYICKARKPECPRCPIIGICRYEPKTTPQDSEHDPQKACPRARRGWNAGCE